MKKRIYIEIGVIAAGLLGSGIWFLFQNGIKHINSYFLILLGCLLMFISLRYFYHEDKKKENEK